MRHGVASNAIVCGLAIVVLTALPVLTAPVDSDRAAAPLGGGCHPTGLQPSLFDMLTLINPEWAPVVNGSSVDSAPVVVRGVVEHMHGDTSGDFPSTHLRADVVHTIRLDPADADRLATGNDDGLFQFEWEAGVYPAWAWAGVGDRLIGLGRYIFDCGHPGERPGRCSVTTIQPCVLDYDCEAPTCTGCSAGETCVGTHFAYSTELHPPFATVAIREGRGAIVSTRPAARPVAATRADIFVSAARGGAGDRCVLQHREDDLELLRVECYPLVQPVAPLNDQDFIFDVPLPPRPRRAKLAWRLVTYDAPGGVPARLRVRRRHGADHLEVLVRMTRPVRGALPTGFAGTLFAGWRNDRRPLVHVRVHVTALEIRNALRPAKPVAPKSCSESDTPCASAAECPAGEKCWGVGPVRSWKLQAAVNGEWQELAGIAAVETGDVIPQTLVYEQYLPPDGALHLEVNGAAEECIATMYGKSLATDLDELGLFKGVDCLASEARSPGAIDLTFSGADFGAGDHETVSAGGAGGACSVSTDRKCVVDADCPSGESCRTTGGAFALRYRIEKL